MLRALYRESERKLKGSGIPSCLNNAISKLVRLVGIDPVDRCILAFAVMTHNNRLLDESTCGDLLDRARVSRIAECESLSPAVISRAADIAHAIRSDLEDSAGAIELLVNNTLEAQGHRSIRKIDPNRLPEVYNPAFIHADTDLANVTRGLMREKTGRLCLYGPPGTGKSAYARWLAEQIAIPLQERRASDLMSKWVGETEKLIAGTFREAWQDGALLLIDEVDSFLRDAYVQFV